MLKAYLIMKLGIYLITIIQFLIKLCDLPQLHSSNMTSQLKLHTHNYFALLHI